MQLDSGCLGRVRHPCTPNQRRCMCKAGVVLPGSLHTTQIQPQTRKIKPYHFVCRALSLSTTQSKEAHTLSIAPPRLQPRDQLAVSQRRRTASPKMPVAQQEFREVRRSGNPCCRIVLYALATVMCMVALTGYLILTDGHLFTFCTFTECKLVVYGLITCSVVGFALCFIPCCNVPVLEPLLSTLVALLATTCAGFLLHDLVSACDVGTENERVVEACIRDMPYQLDMVVAGTTVGAILWLVSSIAACCSVNCGRRWVVRQYYSEFQNPAAVM
ncbi:hypothetical protein PTSG_04504 [Salpingoeca rosetta]|uniref:MARVEL domain-containing protein n=1 Tax=Salpingoeca rosetta (strain ATCC 50818 / BSB-021) TaxID=946362 RepID=F2U8S0_SALR5|nr:uncharacterized protein PTSG_04504 [Salpingoeca rosetta]EGD72778.1 hypothetical protein PTSG_04504 [Salpingoeca rosetta]|eukprot:XP_004994601.1 hypothetical protein PTSG_04504 [Salpingoeca rosetta]